MDNFYADRARLSGSAAVVPKISYSSQVDCQSPRPPSPLELQGLDRQTEHVYEDLGIAPGMGQQFFKHVPPRLTAIRLQLCTLARAQTEDKKRSCLAGLSMQCQWLASYARMGGFHAVSQVAAALESFAKDLYEQANRLNESVIRTMAQAADLLGGLAGAAPSKAGRAEGARVLVVDENGRSRAHTLAVLEAFAIAGIGIANADAATKLLSANSVDLVILRADSSTKMAPKVCQAIRRIPGQQTTPILVLSGESDWESRAVLAMSGASEVVQRSCLSPELALKVYGHFFRGRLNGQDG